ncbi:MAG: MobC family plasmid mobilization relaxosome protein [Lachnospiraceae bacterium]|nr:MobC family plasmid mobilization relaxosome protein [Lachnospiraceae bacterium]
MSRKRHKAVTVRLSEYEWNSLEERIEESGQNKQSYMINALLGAEIAPKEEINTWKEIAGQFSELIKQLRGIATNINQIAHKANATGELPLINALEEINEQVAEIRKAGDQIWLSLRQLIAKQKVMQE